MQTVDVSLDQKIEELFSYRRFSELYDIAAVSSALRVEFHQKLKNLQNTKQKQAVQIKSWKS